MPRLESQRLFASLCLFTCACQGELDATLDILPERYPNRLEPGEERVAAVLYRPSEAFGVARGARAVAARADAAPSGDEALEQAEREVIGTVVFRDVDGDGGNDAVADFSAVELAAAGLLSGAVEIRIESDGVTWRGRDRLFAPDAPLVVLPEPSGGDDVGTAALLVFDASRPGNDSRGRALLLRLWYPAAPGERQPAPYFLDPLQAERNLRSAPLPLPADLFELTHGFARQHARAAPPERRPALLLSTGWGAPVETYTALAEELASQGYLVLGVNHPNGSGVVVYPDGSEPSLTPSEVNPDETNHLDWALDLERVADWLSETSSVEAALASVDARARPDVGAALGQLDRGRIAALGHSFGGAAAVRADAESERIVASANLDGAFVGNAAGFAERTQALVLLSPEHPALDSSIDAFLDAGGARCRGFTIADTGHANYGDTSWLYARVLEEYPDLTREGYQLGPITPARAHAITSTYLRAFFEAAFAGQTSPLLEAPSALYPEVTLR